MNTTDKKTKKAEEILKKMKQGDRKASKPYQGPPDLSFIALEEPKPESDRDVNDGAGRRDQGASAQGVQFLYSR